MAGFSTNIRINTSESRKIQYLLQFVNEHIDFRIPEILSLSDLFQFPLLIDKNHNPKSPYMVVDAPSEACVQKLASRSVLIKSAFELWASGNNTQDLYQRLSSIPAQFREAYCNPEKSFRVTVDAFNRQLTLPEKVAKIEHLLTHCMDFGGRIDLNNADMRFHLFELYESREELVQLYFGRWIADGQRDLLHKFNLKDRKFIGNTSMDPCLAFIMANLGHATPAQLVCDPFVGTGGLLLACAHFGSYVIGTDMDYKLLHGQGRSSRAGQMWRSSDESIYSNLAQYGLQDLYLDAILADASRHSLWRRTHKFDLIITDPPYGIREPTKKVGKYQSDAADEAHTICEGLIHYPSKVQYPISQVYTDLLNFAAKYLRVGGRLVFWLPVYTEEYSEECIPRHPCLQLLYNSEQLFSTKVGRRLLTMEKHVESQDQDTLEGAVLDRNPFEYESFREKYFGPEAIARERGIIPADSKKLSRREKRQLREEQGRKVQLKKNDIKKLLKVQAGEDNGAVRENSRLDRGDHSTLNTKP